MKTTANSNTERTRPLFQATPLHKLEIGDIFCLSGFGLKDRIAYTRGESFRRKKGKDEVEVCKCYYKTQDACSNIVEMEKIFETDSMVLLMQRKSVASLIGNS